MLGQPERRCECRPVGERRAELRLAVAHPEKARPRRIALELDLDRADAFLEEEPRGPGGQEALGREHPARADGRMAGERHLPRGREDAHARGAVRPRRRQEEGRLGQVHLPRDRLHLRVAESRRVEHDGQRIAAEHAVGEDVDLDEAVLAHRAPGQRPVRRSISKIRGPVSGTVFTRAP